MQADQIYPTTLTEYIFASGQRDFSKIGVTPEPIDSSVALWSLVNTHSLQVEFTDPTTGKKNTETLSPTLYEAYDLLSGQLSQGSSIYRQINKDGKTSRTEGKIVSINETAVNGDTSGKITLLEGSGHSPILSAAGKLIFDAPVIEQGGVVKAPFGQITLNARTTDAVESGKVIVKEASLTSVSAENSVIPFGELDSSGSLIYRTDPKANPVSQRLFSSALETNVLIKADKVDLQSGSTIDLSGGGDLQAMRFVPGPGGSKDVLAPENAGDSFALVPALQSGYAPFDPYLYFQADQSSSALPSFPHAIGKTIYLEASEHLPAGEYQLLPARYATLPGAVLVTPLNDGKIYDQGQNLRRVDGAQIVAGRFAIANTNKADSLMSGFVVEPGSVVGTRSEYVTALASELFSSNQDLRHPGDAANLILLAGKTLNINSNIQSTPGEKGKAAQLNIVSDHLKVVNQFSVGANDGQVELLAEQLNSDAFGSVLLGGRRNQDNDGLTISAESRSITVADDVDLSVSELILVAKGNAQTDGQITLGKNVNLSAVGNSKSGEKTSVEFLGDSLIRLSTQEQWDITQASNTQGNISIDKTATTEASGAQAIFSNSNTELNGKIAMTGGSLSIGAGKISLGEVNSDLTGLKFTTDDLQNLPVDELILNSSSSVDLYGSFNLSLKNLVLKTGAILGINDQQHAATIHADNLTLSGLVSTQDSFTPQSSLTNLTLSANNLSLAEGQWNIQGFDKVSINATKSLSGQDESLVTIKGNDSLTINSPLLTGRGASNTQIISEGNLLVNSSGEFTTDQTGLGAKLSLTGKSIDFAGNAYLPSGTLTLSAFGNQGEDIVLKNASVIDVSGKNILFDRYTVASDAGVMNLHSQSGDVIAESGAKIRLSGITGNQGSAAGRLTVEANKGKFISQATISAESGNKKQGGSLDLLVNSFSDFSQLLTQISAGNFTESVVLQTRTGNLTVAENERIGAREIILTADDGLINIAGQLDSKNSDTQKSYLALNAKDDIYLQSTAIISSSKNVGNDEKNSGNILLSTIKGSLIFDKGSQINTQSGKVTLRAPRLENAVISEGHAAGNEVAITLNDGIKLNQLISGADRVDVNAVKVYEVNQYTSEIFNRDLNSNSTLITAYDFLPYKVVIPFGAVCEQSDGCLLIESTEIEFQAIPNFITVNYGDKLPVGYLCGSEAGCSYSYDWNYDELSIANVDTKKFMTYAETIESRLFGEFSSSDLFQLQPELEIQSKGDLVLDHNIDFAKGLGVFQLDPTGAHFVDHDSQASVWRFNESTEQYRAFSVASYQFETFSRYTKGTAGVLSLRAEGDVQINAELNDGFVDVVSYEKLIATGFINGVRKELSDEKHGWSFNLVAGADLASGNFLLASESANISLQDHSMIRTNTGDINIVSGGSIDMGTSSRIYTSGYATQDHYYANLANASSDFSLFDFNGLSNVIFGKSGGEINLIAANNITANGIQQFVTDWLQRLAKNDVESSRLKGALSGILPTTWAISPDDFLQGIATLGGGDIHLSAGNDISNLTVALPTTGKSLADILPAEGESFEQYQKNINNNIEILGGGNLYISAGGDIDSSQVMIGRGQAVIKAGGKIGSGQGDAVLLEVMDGNLTLSAAGSIEIADIINPTVGRLSAYQTGSEIVSAGTPFIDLNENSNNNKNFFFTYAEDSGVTATSLSGDVVFTDNQEFVVRKNDSPFVTGGSESLTLLPAFTPRLNIVALQGDVRFDSLKTYNLFPSSKGQLSILATNNLVAKNGSVINVSDVNPLTLANRTQTIEDLNVSTPFLPIINLINPSETAGQFNLMHASTPLYLNSHEKMKLIAAQGDIDNVRLISPTATEVVAGKNINNITLEIQHTKANDISSITAGGDIQFSVVRNPSTNALDFANSTQGIDIAGMGRLDVMAAGDVELGASRGIQSIGTANNPNLLRNGFVEEAGADISIFAGIKKPMNVSGFIDQYFSDFAALDSFTKSEELIAALKSFQSSDRDAVVRFIKQVSAITQEDYFAGDKVASLSDEQLQQILSQVKLSIDRLDAVSQQQIAFHFFNSRMDNYTGDLVAFVTSEKMGAQQLDASSLLDLTLQEQHTQALVAFKNAPVSVQRELILQTYFNEIRQGGIADISGDIENPETDGFARSYAAIESLFPGASTEELKPEDYSGDISLIFSTVQTQQGGDINLLAPGGSIDVGVAAVGGGVSKDSSKLGLIALRNGQVNAAVFDNINVNSSRVFALDGGDITLWSSYGNLDAGRGAKTALSVPPPIINSDGSVNFQAAVTGSGIRNSRFTENRAPGAVYLFAPDGVVNAGDAGIGSQGDVLIAAQQVIGADNIDVGGISVGIPVATGVSANLAGAAAAAGAATDSTTDELLEKDMEENVDQRRPAFVTIDILGMDF